MAEEPKEQKKIIVDEDWKQQAKKEKDILAEQEKAEKEKARHQRRQALPEGNFAALVSMLVTQALFSLGLIQVEGQQPREPDPELAKYNIDMLEMLEAKTKGNLTEQEQKVLTDMLNEVRMAYVKVAG
jgi:hypothetical protein